MSSTSPKLKTLIRHFETHFEARRDILCFFLASSSWQRDGFHAGKCPPGPRENKTLWSVSSLVRAQCVRAVQLYISVTSQTKDRGELLCLDSGRRRGEQLHRLKTFLWRMSVFKLNFPVKLEGHKEPCRCGNGVACNENYINVCVCVFCACLCAIFYQN